MSRNTYRIVVTFVLACFLTVSAQALPLSAPRLLDRSEPAGLTAIWEWISSRFLSGLAGIWEQAGSQMDPNGTSGDAGSGMDPNGVTDEGSHMDPNGLDTDEGSQMDPNG